MPTITDNMSEDGKSVEQRFIDILYNGGSAGELSGALGKSGTRSDRTVSEERR